MHSRKKKIIAILSLLVGLGSGTNPPQDELSKNPVKHCTQIAKEPKISQVAPPLHKQSSISIAAPTFHSTLAISTQQPSWHPTTWSQEKWIMLCIITVATTMLVCTKNELYKQTRAAQSKITSLQNQLKLAQIKKERDLEISALQPNQDKIIRPEIKKQRSIQKLEGEHMTQKNEIQALELGPILSGQKILKPLNRQIAANQTKIDLLENQIQQVKSREDQDNNLGHLIQLQKQESQKLMETIALEQEEVQILNEAIQLKSQYKTHLDITLNNLTTEKEDLENVLKNEKKALEQIEEQKWQLQTDELRLEEKLLHTEDLEATAQLVASIDQKAAKIKEQLTRKIRHYKDWEQKINQELTPLNPQPDQGTVQLKTADALQDVEHELMNKTIGVEELEKWRKEAEKQCNKLRQIHILDTQKSYAREAMQWHNKQKLGHSALEKALLWQYYRWIRNEISIMMYYNHLQRQMNTVKYNAFAALANQSAQHVQKYTNEVEQSKKHIELYKNRIKRILATSVNYKDKPLPKRLKFLLPQSK